MKTNWRYALQTYLQTGTISSTVKVQLGSYASLLAIVERADMSDVGDVNRAHLQDEPKDKLALYVQAARRMVSQNATMADRMAFQTFHSSANVAALGDLIDQLRAENSILLDALYGEDRHD